MTSEGLGRMPSDLKPEEHDRIMAFYIEACKLAIDLGIGRVGLAGILGGMSRQLWEDERPLEYYVANPKGTPRWQQ